MSSNTINLSYDDYDTFTNVLALDLANADLQGIALSNDPTIGRLTSWNRYVPSNIISELF